MTTKFRCPKCNGLGNFILNIETNETSCKDCGVVFNKLTTKEKLEQLGWNILNDDLNIHFVYMRRKNDDNNYDMIIFNKEYKEIDLTSIISFSTTINELQLILDYIKEQENDK